MNFKEEKTASLFRELVADFIQKESNGRSMITLHSIRHLGDKIVFLCTVIPEDESPIALDFLKRKRGDVRRMLQEKTRMRNVPIVDFEIESQTGNVTL